MSAVPAYACAVPTSVPAADPPESTGRRGLLRVGLTGAAALAVGGGAGAGAVRYSDTHLSPTARVAPRPDEPGRYAVRVLFQGASDCARACVTFDDGPDPRWTPLVLDILADLGVPATFFVLGEAVTAHPELVAREAEAGHEVAIHNWAHTDVYGVEVGELRDSVDQTIAAIEDAGAPAPRLWRPPYGRVDAPALMVAAERGLDVLLWSEHTPTAQAAADAAGAAHAGSVILCHDGRSQPSEELLRTLGESIAALQARGLAFVTGSRMLEGAAGGIGTVIEP